MGFFSSFKEKWFGKGHGEKDKDNVVTFPDNGNHEKQGSHEKRVESADADVVSIDRSKRENERKSTQRQEVAKLTREVFTELKELQAKTRELNETKHGRGILGKLDRELRTKFHGNIIRVVLWGGAAIYAHSAVQSEWFSGLLGQVTAIGAVVATLLLTREAIKTVSETIDYYFRGERSRRKALEMVRASRKHYKNERRLTVQNYRKGEISSQEYIHYMAELVKDVRSSEEGILYGASNEGTVRKPLIGLKETMSMERSNALARAIGSTVAAPAVTVLFGGLQLGINEWDMKDPAHRVTASLQGLQYHKLNVPGASGRVFESIPHQAWSAFTIGATTLVGKAIQEAAQVAKKFDKRRQEDAIVEQMERSIENIKQLESRIHAISDITPSVGGRRRLNAEHMKEVNHPPQEAFPSDFSDLVGKEAMQYSGQPEPSLLDRVLGRVTRPIEESHRTAPLAPQDFDESPSLFRTECVRKIFGVPVASGTLMTHEAFMEHLDRHLATLSDTAIIEQELYLSSESHRHEANGTDEHILATLNDAARRCAAERKERVREKTALIATDPNTLRAQILLLIGMDDEIAVGQKYFEKLFAQGYARASRVQRGYFNEVLSALDLSLNANDTLTRKREKNIIFDSIRTIIEQNRESQEEAA